MLNRIRIWFWDLVFAMKCRAGFKLLGPADVRGIVTSMEFADDGDVCFDIDPVEGERLLSRTPGAAHRSFALHCEVVPHDTERLAPAVRRLRVGATVRVVGTWAWDGCHHGRGTLFDILMVLLRAAPTLDGWHEIHPVAKLEILG